MQTDTKYVQSKPEVWGGIECSITRIEDLYRDQFANVGHYHREQDLHEIAALNIKALRYPVLWERHQPSPHAVIDWRWAERRLNTIRQLGMNPIVGLLHHGSGPSFTSMHSPDFPTRFAEYASAVAKKFPWVTSYCPVNEPLTTARFSGLYGFWYPHHKNDLSFFTMLLNELKATVLAMQAIREINSEAKLIQTEDVTKVHSTPLLKYQADFENNRRWLSFDLLLGKVNKYHPLWDYLTGVGVKKEDLMFFEEHPCAPDVFGLNYYVTSERFLDEHLDRYHPNTHGGNGRHQYADVEAVRVLEPSGLNELLKETWERYRTPIAVTEVHMHCTREDQLRWWTEAWNTCVKATQDGIPVKAVTAWAMLGAYDWNSLMIRDDKHYESGVFDCRNGVARKTVLARAVASNANGKDFHHPVLEEKGWWHRSDRFLNPPALCPNRLRKKIISSAHRLLIIGKERSLGEAFCRACDAREISYCVVDQHLILQDSDILEELIKEIKPWAVVNVTRCSTHESNGSIKKHCIALHQHLPHRLATYCRDAGIRLLSLSSAMVFDGKKKTPYIESDGVKPINIIGESWALGEQLMLNTYPESLVVRTSSCFGPWNPRNRVQSVIDALTARNQVQAYKDVLISPTYLPDVVHTALDLLIDEERGIWHLSNNTHLTCEDFARNIAKLGGYQMSQIEPVPYRLVESELRFPANSALACSKGIVLPDLESALARYFTTK